MSGVSELRTENSPMLSSVSVTFASFKDFNVSRQSPNPSRRKGANQGSCGLQTGDRREVRRQILHHFDGWQGCPTVSLRRMGKDRSQAEWAFELQCLEEEVSHRHQLLRTDGGNGWAGPVVAAAVVTRVGGAEG